MRPSRIVESDEYKRGLALMAESSVSICSIVRDCRKNLAGNIERIEKLRTYFKESEIIVYENDSIDGTKSLLQHWMKHAKNSTVFLENFKSNTIPVRNPGNVNRYYSIYRIEKMAMFRNKYMDVLHKNNFQRDFVIIIDLDISGFDIHGVIHSFGISQSWDCIAANGISLSSRFSTQYHDTYAFVELGKINAIQTEESIRLNRIKYAHLKAKPVPVEVDSAFGGLAIYKWYSIKGLNYAAVPNHDVRVESRCEHVYLHKSMKERGAGTIFINPAMIVKYRSISLSLVIKHIKDMIFN